MLPNPGQFNNNKLGKHEESLKKSERIKDSGKPTDKDYESYKNDYLKSAPSGRYNGYKAPDGSWHGHPQSESAIKAHYKWSKMNPDQRKAHTEGIKKRQSEIQKAHPQGMSGTKPKKDFNKDTEKPKKKDKYKDDDDKNPPMSGGSKVPRKPKPSPKGPGEYRPIERTVDQDYAKKTDRYRVMVR